tara:strand:- start:472 stop:1284 length:813 start_codon:yes stop_codon:yes gene_type:complete
MNYYQQGMMGLNYNTNDPYQLALKQMKMQDPVKYNMLMSQQEQATNRLSNTGMPAFMQRQRLAEVDSANKLANPYDSSNYSNPVANLGMSKGYVFEGVSPAHYGNKNFDQFIRGASTKYVPPNIPPKGASGMLSVDALANKATEEAVAESVAKSAVESPEGLTAPQAFFANMALEAIPTRDRNKVNTPFGNQGSVPGILKGAGKGALLGSTIDTATGGATGGLGTIGGAIIGGVSGAQGTFDSTSPRQVIQRSYTRPRAGGLLAPKGLYG